MNPLKGHLNIKSFRVGLLSATLILFAGCTYEDRTAEEWAQQCDELARENAALKESLEQANSNIEDAKGYAWNSYEEMGEALDNLETVSEP